MKSAVFLYNTQSGKCKIGHCTDSICTVFRAYGYEITPQPIDFEANPFDGNEQIDLMVVADGEAFDFNSLMVLVFNGETAGGFRLARRSSIKDGLFDCLMLEKKNFLRSTLAMGRYLLGGNPKIVRHLRARALDIVSTLNEPTDVDGQKGAEFPLHIECIAGGLRVMCPREEGK